MYLLIQKASQLNFYPIQSETCSLAVPELKLELEPGTLGGQFTTVEGILTQIKDQLSTSHPFVMGDSCEPESKMKKFIEELNEVTLLEACLA